MVTENAPKSFLAMGTTEAGFVVDDITSTQPLCSVNSFVA